MKEQSPAFGLEYLPCVDEADDLAGGYGHDGALLIVVVLAAVHDVAALDLLQEYGVEAEDLAAVVHRAAFREVDHTDKRIECLDSHCAVVFADSRKGCDFFLCLFHCVRNIILQK